MFRSGDILELSIDSAAFEGKSVARVGGFVVFVDGGVPGDRLRARVVRVRKQHAEAVVAEVLDPSPSRTEPVCRHFGTCGGCRWQHVRYDEQLRFKQQHVVDSFERIGGLRGIPVAPIIGCDESFWYRNKMEFSFSHREWTAERPVPGQESEGVFLGLHAPGRFDKVLDLRECHLQSELSNRIVHATRDFAAGSGMGVYRSDAHDGYWRFVVVRQSKRTQQCMVNVVTFSDQPSMMREYASMLQQECAGVTTVVNTVNATRSQVATGSLEKVYAGDGTITERLGRLSLTISARSFFQTNTEQAERLYEAALAFAGLRADDIVYDLYSGTGSIALFMADRVSRVVGIESVAQSVADARQNAARNGIANCEFLVGDMKDALRALEASAGSRRPRVVVVDPPRSGMHEKAVRDVVTLAPEKVVYISCNPATQARDCKLFAASGYRVTRLQPVDMFPHTYHIENVAELVRENVEEREM